MERKIEMKNRDHLLSIGEVSKLTLISISALRFYDKKNLVKPVHVDPSSGYRYYSMIQVHDLSVIKLAVEIGIPLQEITKYYQTGKIRNIDGLLTLGESLALEKRAEIDKDISFIQKMKLKLSEQSNYQNIHDNFITEYDKRFFYCTEFAGENSILALSESIEKVMKQAKTTGYYPNAEWGKLFVYQGDTINKYIFIDILLPEQTDQNIIEIPRGRYLNTYQENSRILEAQDIQPDLFDSKEKMFVIETETFITNKINPQENLLKLSFQL